ncbi:MAG: radical SAM protein, partial [Eudoraea sp.]|nr:radical SAM protein [Eudoraea sp.]
MKKSSLIKGRGAQSNHPNRFLAHVHELRSDFLEYCRAHGEPVDDPKTQYLPIYPKSIVNEVKSPDLRLDYSMNPYQGCEHGCV